jgi:hypothetical protein
MCRYFKYLIFTYVKCQRFEVGRFIRQPLLVFSATKKNTALQGQRQEILDPRLFSVTNPSRQLIHRLKSFRNVVSNPPR